MLYCFISLYTIMYFNIFLRRPPGVSWEKKKSHCVDLYSQFTNPRARFTVWAQTCKHDLCPKGMDGNCSCEKSNAKHNIALNIPLNLDKLDWLGGCGRCQENRFTHGSFSQLTPGGFLLYFCCFSVLVHTNTKYHYSVMCHSGTFACVKMFLLVSSGTP